MDETFVDTTPSGPESSTEEMTEVEAKKSPYTVIVSKFIFHCKYCC